MPSSKEAIRTQISFRKSKESGRTVQDLLQQAGIEIMRFHDMEDSDFSRLITCDSGGQQCSESGSGMYYWFVVVALSPGCHLKESGSARSKTPWAPSPREDSGNLAQTRLRSITNPCAHPPNILHPSVYPQLP
jgi:hypothetical protein